MKPDQLRRIARRWAIPVVLFTILGGVASYLISRHLTPTYAASGSVLVLAGPPTSAGSGAISINPTEATTTAATLLTEPTLINQVVSNLKLNLTSDAVAKEVSATPVTSSELVDVTVRDPSPERAAAIANALMTAYVNEVTQSNNQRISMAGAAIQGQINSVQATLTQEQQQLANAVRQGQDSTAIRAAISADTALLTQLNLSLSTFRATQAEALDSVSVAQSAPVPTSPSSPNVPLNTVLGLMAALVLSVGFAYAIEFFDQGLKSTEDVRARLGVPCLAVVPKFREFSLSASYKAATGKTGEAVKEAYRRLRTNILFTTPDVDLQTILVTSVRPGEGKTCTAANLAVSLAGLDRRVLLVDADLRRPDQHRVFGTTLDGGLSELILKGSPAASPTASLRPTGYANLQLMTSGAVPPNPSELLASKRAAALLQAVTSREDLVVIDTPPVGMVTDPLSLAANASATLLVVEAGKTNASQAAAAIAALRGVGANVVGVVLNKASRRRQSSYYEYGSAGYGDATGKHAATAADLVEGVGSRQVDAERPAAAATR